MKNSFLRFFGFFFFNLLVVFGIVLFAAGCSRKDNAAQPQGAENKITVSATIFPPYDFVRAIAGDRVNLSMLLPPGAESHSFEPSPQDIITMQNSRLFVYAGGESDEWVDRILESMDTANMKILPLMDCVDAVEEEIVEGMEEEEEEEEGIAYDEHVWTAPKNAARIVQAIADALCALDAANADFYRQNSAAYIVKLEELDAEFRAVADNAKRKTIIFGDRFPFRYLADSYGLSYYAAFPGCSTETECSAATVAFLIDKMKSERVPVIFHIELSNEKIADTIAEATGAKKLLLHACHNISKSDFEKGEGYLSLMRGNLRNLREALN
ncbi:MAG: metal ABC transporter substrate-binding protein [Spirochaetia bacterium]|jgi:zinc transport system substrate-binding protein|nr:metal ABC transporter substrate-binding protein [Spirochaetia bacterium]